MTFPNSNGRGYLVLDLETVPDLQVWTPPPAEAGAERPFAPLYAQRPIVIGVLWLDERYALKRVGIIGEHKDEPGALADYAQFIERERPHLVTWNGRGFDLPVLALRCLRHGLTLRAYYADRNARYRFSEEGHLDLCDAFSDYGATKMIGLSEMARLIGLPGKVGVDGSQVEGLYNAGQLEAIRHYCLSDVAQTAFLLLRFRLLQGMLSLPQYQSAARALLDALAADGRLDPVVDHIDRPRLLLEPAA